LSAVSKNTKYFYSNNTIDLSQYSKLIVTVSDKSVNQNSEVYCGFYGAKSFNITYGLTITSSNGNGVGTYTFDLSNVTGNYYFIVGIYSFSNWAETARVAFTKIDLVA
jgi:hypothetical protein